MKKHHLLLITAFMLIGYTSTAQIKLKKKAEKKANDVIDNLLFGKKKKKASQTSSPNSSSTSTSGAAGGKIDSYTPKEVDWEGIDVGSTIHFSTLIDMLPESTQGFSRSEKPEGAMYSTAGFKYSTAIKQYNKDGQSLTISLSDYLGAEYLVATQTQKYEYESTDGFVKSIEEDGMSGWISVQYEDNQGSLVLTKAGRILLSISTTNTTESELKSILNDIDLSKLPIQ